MYSEKLMYSETSLKNYFALGGKYIVETLWQANGDLAVAEEEQLDDI